MNSYERYAAMAEGKPVDCLPRVPILMHFAAAHIGATYAGFARDYRVLVEANTRLVEEYGFDQLDIMSDPFRETADFGGELEYLDDTVPRCTRPPLCDSKDPGLLSEVDPRTAPRMRNALQALEAFREYGWRRYSITGWVEGPAAEAADVRGVSAFLMDLLTDEAFACALMDRVLDTAIAFARLQVETGADTIGVGDAIASQLSPDLYERLVLPREKKLVDAIHDAGAWVRLHICGDITALLPHIATLGVDILDCDWMVDLSEARRHMGGKTVLTGNLDPVRAVMDSTPERIRAALLEAYAQAGNPYFVNAGCEIPAGTPEENLRALCEPIVPG